MPDKKILVDLDMASVSKMVNLPAASANGEAVRYNEFAELDTNCDNVISLSGMPENSTHLGAFLGSTIADNRDIKAALQDLETEVEKTSLTIAAESQSVLSITGNELKMESLAITDVTVDTSETSLANWISNNATHGLEMGDVLILTAASDKMEMTWICNSNTPSQSPASASDFTRLQADIQAQDVRAFLAGESDEIDYNSTTGVFSFSANAAENILPTSHTWVGLGTPSSVQSFMELADQEFKNIQGGTSLEVGSVTTAKLAADAVTAAKLADDAVVTSNIVDANITLAKMAANSVDSDQFVDGSIDLIHMSDNSVDSRCYVDESIDLAHMSDDSVDSRCIVDGAIDLVHMSANSVDSDQYVDGSIDLIHMSDNSVDSRCYVDGSLEFVHLDSAGVCSDFSSAGADQVARADSIKAYVDGRTYVRKLFSAQSLTADTEATLNHALSNKYVSVQVFDDTNDKEVDFELTLTDANNCKVEVAVSGTYSILVIG